MPKGKRKGKSVPDRDLNEGSGYTDEDASLYADDDTDIVSNSSETASQTSEGADGFSQLSSHSEERLNEILDGLTQKSAQGRTDCFHALRTILAKQYLPHFVRDRHFTICDCIEKSLKRGNVGEKCAAAELIPVIATTIGDESDISETVYDLFRPLLMTAIADNTYSAKVRAKCCLALAVVGIFSADEREDNFTPIHILENIFTGSCLKGDGTVPNIQPEMASLHAAAINAWTLLVTNFMTGALLDLIENKEFVTLEQLSELLESPHLEVRLAAGEALAVVFESARKQKDLDFGSDFTPYVIEVFKKLATDSHKYRAKKERKQQRATFRDILQYVEDDIMPDVQIKFGRETLYIDTWTQRKHYDVFSSILGPGTNNHLRDNIPLRNIFEFEDPSDIQIEVAQNHHKVEKRQKRLYIAATSKARSINRGKNRDKRSDFY